MHPNGDTMVVGSFSDNYPNCIVIHYGYFDWRYQYESRDEVIPMDVLIEFNKRYKNEKGS